MLECASLHVDPWTWHTAEVAAPAWTRRITDDAAACVGFVRYDGAVKSTWFSWLRSVRLEVYETEDASHLMSLVRAWGVKSIWDVYDAEDRHVGSIYPPTLVDSEGERRAHFRHCGPEGGEIVDSDGCVLASFHENILADVEVMFMEEPSRNPFLRMLVLAGILALDATPAHD